MDTNSNNTDDSIDLTTNTIISDDNDNGWCQVQRRRNNKINIIPPIQRPYITQIRSDVSTRVAPLAPIISISNTGNSCITTRVEHSPRHSPRDTKDCRQYHRLREVSGIVGFVVNIHDATNFDIDLQLPSSIKHKYCTVITNQYTYKDLGNQYVINPSSILEDTVILEVGTTYRCRLRGIGINQLPSSVHTRKSHNATLNVKQLIDRTDGWVSCTLSDIDVYQRLLVDICVHTSTNDGCVNIKNYLLEKMQEESLGEMPIFYPYTRERSIKY